MCSAAVMHVQDDKYGCYLFNCGSPAVCSFTSHTGYSAFHMVTEIIDTHASDLANLVSVRSPTQPTTTATVPATVTDHLVTGLFCHSACLCLSACLCVSVYPEASKTRLFPGMSIQ